MINASAVPVTMAKIEFGQALTMSLLVWDWLEGPDMLQEAERRVTDMAI